MAPECLRQRVSKILKKKQKIEIIKFRNIQRKVILGLLQL